MDESKLREKHRSRIPLVALFCALTGCVAAEESKPCLSLEEVRRFGHAEVIREGLDDHEIAAGGGVLGRIRGVVAGPDRTVYVLDRDWQKIVGFGPDGHVTHVVLGGEGEGPGEFITPIDLTETGRGFSVLDYELQRLTEFSWAGEILGTSEVRFKQPWRHLVRGDTVWIGYSSGGPSDDPVFDRLKLSGEPLDRGPTLDEEDRPFGTTVGMAFGAGGEVLTTSARPGVWYSHTEGTWVRHGQPLFPEAAPTVLEQIAPGQSRLTPSQYTAAGIASIGDSLVLQGFSWFAKPFDWNAPPARNETRNGLIVFSRTGDHLATIELPSGVSAALLSTEVTSGRVFLNAVDPFPQVVEYRLAECTAPRARTLQPSQEPSA